MNYLYESPDKGKTVYKVYENGKRIKISNKQLKSEIFKKYGISVI